MLGYFCFMSSQAFAGLETLYEPDSCDADTDIAKANSNLALGGLMTTMVFFRRNLECFWM